MCARQIARLISLIALILCESPISMNHSKYSTAVKWGNMSVFVPPNVDVAIEKGERLVLLSGIGIHEIIADKVCVNITILGLGSKVVDCVSASYDYPIYSWPSLNLERYHGNWVLNISTINQDTDRTSYIWWVTTNPPRSIAETTVFVNDGSLLPWDVEIATGRQLSIGYRMAAHNVTDQSLEDNRGRISLDVNNVYDESGRCNMHIKILVNVSLQDNFLVIDIANISYELENATAKHSLPTTKSPGLHAPSKTMRRKNTIFVPPNVDLAIERGQRLMLLSGFDANDGITYMVCVNISIPGQEAKIVGCVFDSPDYGKNNGKNYSLEQVNGAWALNISSAMTKINQITYSWWLKTDPPRTIAETLISIHDVSVSPWYVKTRAGKRVSVCYVMQERNAIDISLTDNRGRHVFDFVNSDGEGTNFNFHLTTNINVSLHNNLMVIDLANVSCQNHGYYKLAITTQSSVTNIDLHLYVIDKAGYNRA
ncbi:uncharacterized protein [Ptychodera flava]|uniref:uncharacterized protein isoform X2 n=1 Tax=Ptychodera flava TaxID=63121 RepID=UPI003969D347